MIQLYIYVYVYTYPHVRKTGRLSFVRTPWRCPLLMRSHSRFLRIVAMGSIAAPKEHLRDVGRKRTREQRTTGRTTTWREDDSFNFTNSIFSCTFKSIFNGIYIYIYTNVYLISYIYIYIYINILKTPCGVNPTNATRRNHFSTNFYFSIKVVKIHFKSDFLLYFFPPEGNFD